MSYATAVDRYRAARAQYRRFSMRTRPAAVTKRYAAAKAALHQARGGPACPSPHLNTDASLCASCPAPCYRKGDL